MRRFQDRGRAANPAAAVKARIEVEKFRETLALIFPEAGHALGNNGWMPTTQYNAGLNKSGGTPQANAAAQARAFPETIAFLKRTLRVAQEKR
jgi:hypothetical protein